MLAAVSRRSIRAGSEPGGGEKTAADSLAAGCMTDERAKSASILLSKTCRGGVLPGSSTLRGERRSIGSDRQCQQRAFYVKLPDRNFTGKSRTSASGRRSSRHARP